MEYKSVGHLVPVSNKKIENLTESIKRLSEISKEYSSTFDIASLERMKRSLNAELQYFATLFASIKALKGPNHTYLESALKQVKSDTVSFIMSSESISVTAAERSYPSHPKYVETEASLLKFATFFIKCELLYEQFNNTLKCITQSVSVLSKEYDAQKSS